MTNRTTSRHRLIKTPIHHIAIGIPIKNEDGNYALRIKKPNSPEYEDFPLKTLIEMVISGANDFTRETQIPRREGIAAPKTNP